MKSNTLKGLALLVALMLVGAGSASAEVVRGKVSNIDSKANRITLQANGKDHSFTFDPQDFIVWKGDDEVKTDEIKNGTDAEVGYYTDETGIEIASWVDLTPVEEGEEISVPAETSMPEPDATAAPESAEPEMPSPDASSDVPATPPPAETPGTSGTQ